MGATTFVTKSKGLNVDDAFTAALAEARHQYGHGGYTGTIAEKTSWEMAPAAPAGIEIEDYAFASCDLPQFSDKWGPAGCLDLGDGWFLFFGWASE